MCTCANALHNYYKLILMNQLLRNYVCRTNDYVLAKIDLNGDVLIEANQGVGICEYNLLLVGLPA